MRYADAGGRDAPLHTLNRRADGHADAFDNAAFMAFGGLLMNWFQKAKESFRKVKGVEWALLLVVLGLAGSFLLAPGNGSLFASSGPNENQQSASDALEARVAQTLSCLEGAGKVIVVIHYAKPVKAASNWLEPATTEEGEPVSAIVLAEGADNIKVRLELSRAVQTLLRLNPEDVEIFKMGTEGKEE